MVVIFDMFIVTALSNAGIRKSQRVRVIILVILDLIILRIVMSFEVSIIKVG